MVNFIVLALMAVLKRDSKAKSNINLAIRFSVELIELSYYVDNRFYKFGEALETNSYLHARKT